MIEGHLCQVTGAKLNEKTQILNLEWSTDAVHVQQKYKKDYSTNYVISKTPLLPDPWESYRYKKHFSNFQMFKYLKTAIPRFHKL